MASGYSWGGGQSRCRGFWEKFQKCCMEGESNKCRQESGDYFECLHHRKEIKRALAIQAEYFRKSEKESHKAAAVGSAEVTAGVGVVKEV